MVRNFKFLAVLLVLSFITKIHFTSSDEGANMFCSTREKHALLTFKQGLTDPSHRLSSWVGDNCCTWEGVGCDNMTGSVVRLDLINPYDTYNEYRAYKMAQLGGEINPSLLELKHLKSLDLSWNDFNGTSIPDFLGSLKSLQYLNLSYAGFGGKLPHQLGNLEHLDLSANIFHGTISAAIDNLTSVTSLNLDSNNLEGEIPNFLGNLCRLVDLELSNNNFNGDITGFLTSLSLCVPSSLQSLRLEGNKFLSGSLPLQLGNLKTLNYLDLTGNSFSGPIPVSLGGLRSVRVIGLANNNFNGSLPESLGNLSNLQDLRIYNNSLEGVIGEAHFANLTRLQYLDLSTNSLALNVCSTWIPKFQLKYLYLSSCKLGPQFPAWLRTQNSLSDLDLSNASISDNIPTWFWNFSSQLSILDLSNNQIKGELPNTLPDETYLGSKNFQGLLPRLTSNVYVLDLSNNSVSGNMSLFLCNPLNETYQLITLDLSNNLLVGEIPNCWMHLTSLMVVNLDNNNLYGNIPSSMGSLIALSSFHVRNNSISGELPSSLQNCTRLRTMELGDNELSGSIPAWIGKNLLNLSALALRSNKFKGKIPGELCNLTSLQTLDAAHNNLSGAIPRCFSNLSAMATKKDTSFVVYIPRFDEKILLGSKGLLLEYKSIPLELVTSMDLSYNSLSGEIPQEITSLLRLQYLLLSNNHLTGEIPEKIGDMVLLENLNLSKNQLTGVIPQSISRCYSLNQLNLSYNNLSGEIPTGSQLQTFTESSYLGNDALCGTPLLKKCKRNDFGETTHTKAQDSDEYDMMEQFYVAVAPGFVVGLAGFCAALVFIDKWRVTYGKGRCSKHRDLSNRVYASPQARASAIEKAEALESTLEEEFPTFIKPMLQSHTTGGFWLGLPVDFCKKYLPRKDETITLIDEDMDESPTNYLALKRGLSAGWRGFAIAHNLVDGDALIFQLVETRKFKVVANLAESSTSERALTDNDKIKKCARERAEEVQRMLDLKQPSFVKCMVRSHVSGRFWMSIPSEFRNSNLPKNDVMVTLVDENEKTWIVQSYVGKAFSAGWRLFSIDHNLVEGDFLVFQLVKPAIFKVYIIRAYNSLRADPSIGLQSSEAHEKRLSPRVLYASAEGRSYATDKAEVAADHSENARTKPRTLGQSKGGQRKLDLNSSSFVKAKEVQSKLDPDYPSFVKCMHPSNVSAGFWLVYIIKKEHSSGDDGGSGLRNSSVQTQQNAPCKIIKRGIKGVQTQQSAPCKEIKTPEKTERKRRKFLFSTNSREEGENNSKNVEGDADSDVFGGDLDRETILFAVNRLKQNSNLPAHMWTKYYALCRSQKDILHKDLPEENHELVDGLISETVVIAGHIKFCKLRTSNDEFEAWDKSLKGLKQLGMDVQFLRAKLKRLQKLVCGSEQETEEQREALAQHARIEGEIKTLEAKLVDLKEAFKRSNVVVDKLRKNAKSREQELEKEVDVPW
ncbi:hypothetical protein GIB67_017640 [Kingdonia uniflora]|uniref:TF-B3 domain-containing protein n=1 Tax=Kingdonia uniflora TaxID=39325 RepID=A0A7J7LNA1_9MAGN|nr:hypothetical protein GIB67_017640 [Kingdonia uniflora]